MVENIFDGRRLVRFHEHTHARYAHHASGGSDLFYRFVGLVTRMAIGKRLCNLNA
jgi:hypothetical protein